MKKYEVTLYYHTSVTVVVDAENEDEAIEIAYDEACDEKYDEEFKWNAQEDGSPDVEELTVE